jgi:hypothetical protein
MTLRTITSQTYPMIKSWVETSSLHTLQPDGVRKEDLMTLRTITSQTYPMIKSWVETSSLHTLQPDGVRLAYTQAGSGTTATGVSTH